MNKLSFRLPEGTPPQVRSAISTGILMLLSLVPTISLYFYLAFSTSAWQMFVAAGAVTVYAIISMAAIWQARRGNYVRAGNALIYGLLGGLFTFNLVIADFGLTLGFASTIIAITVGRQLLPPKSARLAIIVTVLGSVFMVVFDQIAPAYRAQMPQLQVYIPIVLGLLVIILLGLLLRPAWGIVSGSLQLKIALWTGAILAVISLILIAYSTITARQVAIQTAQEEALAFAAAQANLVRADSEVPLDMARAIAQALTAGKDPENTYRNLSRSQVNAMLRQMLIENPNFLGTSTLWEPNAFDGQDAYYRGKEGHDLTGRFLPYWVRGDDGSISVTPLVDFETPGTGDWYTLPRLNKREVVIAPLIYPIKGVDTLMATFVAPVVYNNEFYGIVGIDAPISYAQDIVDSIDIYNDQADAFLMTSSGKIISYRNKPELVNQLISVVIPDFFSSSQTRVAAGEAFTNISPDGEYLYVFTPVKLGRTGINWSFGMRIPFTEITAAATAEAIRAGAIGIVLTLFGLILLWFLSGQIVRPLRDLTVVANEVSRGNLNTTAAVQTTDETGLLAGAFNLMITQLRETFNTLEQRVAERTAKMERRNLDLALATEIGQTVSQVRAINDMLKDAAEIIRTFFGLYYVQVYLVNESQTELELQFGTGAVGEELMSRKHRLPLNKDSINGRAAITKRSVVISDTTASDTFRPNPLLPDTRSEVAVPLLVGDTLVGVLDVQSKDAGLLNQDALLAFEPMAGQMAVAIQNSRLVAETEQARAEVESLARRLTHTGWEEYLDAIHKPEKSGFVFERDNITLLTGQETPAKGALVAPIQVTGESLGSLVVELQGTPPSSRTDELINTVARQVSQHIESLRLLDSAERFRYEAEQATRRLTHEGWQEYMDTSATGNTGYIYDLNEVRPYEKENISQAKEAGISLPLKVGDEAIGKLVLQDVDANDREAIGIASAVAERLGAHIEGLRLALQTEKALSTTKKQAQREQALRQITSAVRGSTDPTTILRTAARELGSILGRQTVVQLDTSNKDSATAHENKPVPPLEPSTADGGK
jgi:GAF domain-containing protein/HAMP domain-containing protein